MNHLDPTKQKLIEALESIRFRNRARNVEPGKATVESRFSEEIANEALTLAKQPMTELAGKDKVYWTELANEAAKPNSVLLYSDEEPLRLIANSLTEKGREG